MSGGGMAIIILEISGMDKDMDLVYMLPRMGIIIVESFLMAGSRVLEKPFIKREGIMMDFGKMGRRMAMVGMSLNLEIYLRDSLRMINGMDMGNCKLMI